VECGLLAVFVVKHAFVDGGNYDRAGFVDLAPTAVITQRLAGDLDVCEALVKILGPRKDAKAFQFPLAF
jgi:hypothetical protein